MANHLMLSGNCLALVPTYLLEGVPFWSCSVTWPAGLPQPVVRPMLGPAQPRAPCSSQKLCLCPSLPCPSCQSPASDCGCGPCHTWMQGHAVGSHMCESLWTWMQGRIYSWLAKRNNCGCYYESSICATCKTTACICNHPVTAQLKYEFGLAS